MLSVPSEINSPRANRKGYISPCISFTKFSDDKNKGKTKGLFSNHNYGALTSKGSCKKLFKMPTSADPILQSEAKDVLGTRRKIGSPKISPLTVYSSQRKYNLPSEMGIGNRYERYYTSQVFAETTQSYLFNGKNRVLLGKHSEVSGLLQYDYALPYKDMKITPKIGSS